MLARGQNVFFVELVDVLRGELELLGITTSITVGEFPAPAPARVYVVLPPHEYASLEGPGIVSDGAVLARTMVVSAEQPGSEWFDRNLDWAAAGAVFDINPRGVDAYRRHGVEAALLPLGYTAAWDTSREVRDWDDGRDIDVLFLGCRSDRRDDVLARCADVFGRYSTELVISDNSRPNVATSDNFVAGADKWALLRRARVVLNLHRDDQPYFEWLRVVEAVHAGAVVVTERSTGMAPLRAGRDVVVTSAESLPWVLDHTLSDEPGLRVTRRAALETLRDRPMGAAAATLAFTAASLTNRPVPVGR